MLKLLQSQYANEGSHNLYCGWSHARIIMAPLLYFGTIVLLRETWDWKKKNCQTKFNQKKSKQSKSLGFENMFRFT